jgi:hypothetical protein
LVGRGVYSPFLTSYRSDVPSADQREQLKVFQRATDLEGRGQWCADIHLEGSSLRADWNGNVCLRVFATGRRIMWMDQFSTWWQADDSMLLFHSNSHSIVAAANLRRCANCPKALVRRMILPFFLNAMTINSTITNLRTGLSSGLNWKLCRGAIRFGLPAWERDPNVQKVKYSSWRDLWDKQTQPVASHIMIIILIVIGMLLTYRLLTYETPL